MSALPSGLSVKGCILWLMAEYLFGPRASAVPKKKRRKLNQYRSRQRYKRQEALRQFKVFAKLVRSHREQW
jgi:hypothetical protein